MSTMNDLFAGPPNRPDNPDFWRLSSIILKLKADAETYKDDMVAWEKAWRSVYEAVGDFDAIAYCAVQAGMQVNDIATPQQFSAALRDPSAAFVKCVQTFFDGFIMGAEFVRLGGHQEVT